MKITLHGAAGDVTGSAYLVETEHARFLVDFGMFQGEHALKLRTCCRRAWIQLTWTSCC
jgi:Cft2 family RNA processing exonuclease